jgi:hypothetical protein
VTAPFTRSAARRIFLAAACGLLAVSVACSSNDDTKTNASAVTQTVQVNLPAELLGLKVVRENVKADLTDVKGSYLQSIGLFSFRETSKLLRATLQVGRFNDAAKEQQAKFRGSIIGQMGSSTPVEIRAGTHHVWLSTGSEQNIFTWFDDHDFYVLSIRSDYPFPRTLVRTLLDRQLTS